MGHKETLFSLLCSVTLSSIACGPPTVSGLPQSPIEEASPKPPAKKVSTVAVDADGDTTCALRSDGSVWCWGDVFDRQADYPVHIKGLPAAKQIAVSAGQACVLDGDGAVWCWGRGWYTAVEGEGPPPMVPHPVPGLTEIVTIAMATDFHVLGDPGCAINVKGELLCWRPGSPVKKVPGISGATAVSMARTHTCAISAGTAQCFAHERGFLFLHGLTNQPPLRQIAAADGGHCGLTEDGRVMCWGSPCGEGLWHRDPSAPPCLVSSAGSSPKAVAAHGTRMCITRDGDTRCWHKYRRNKKRPMPEPNVVWSRGFEQVAVGGRHTCGLDAAGQVWCWGVDYRGQLGRGGLSFRHYRVPLAGVAGMGQSMACWLDGGASEGAKCWSRHGYPTDSATRLGGETLNGTKGATGITMSLTGGTMCVNFASDPVRCISQRVLGSWSEDVRELSLGDPTCGITKAGGVRCDSMMGIADDRPVEVEGTPLTQVTRIDTGTNHACAVSGGRVACWGTGIGRGVEVDGAAWIAGLDEATDVATARRSSCAVVKGAVFCWGRGVEGELGSGSFSNRVAAKQVAGLPPVRSIRAGSWHYCALTESGDAWCWGSNREGQMGTAHRRSASRPMRLKNVGKVRSLALGTDGTCVVRDTDSLCFGNTADDVFGEDTFVTFEPKVVEGIGEAAPPPHELSTVEVTVAPGRR